LEDNLDNLNNLGTGKFFSTYSVGLVGIRNITKLVVGGVSPFNIADQFTLPPFTLGNVRAQYAQYSVETNQPFTAAAVQRVHEETRRDYEIKTLSVPPVAKISPKASNNCPKGIALPITIHQNTSTEEIYPLFFR
jgi:hypothetical protein